MAKNVLQQKKRLTHIGKISNKNTEGSLSSECVDYVQNIMQEMDCGMQSIGIYKPNKLSKEKRELGVLNNELQTIKTSSNALPNWKASNAKYTIHRKFPLMEKSQKFLKQLKHNRKLPKQRAHLASLQHSVNKNNKHKTSSVSEKKVKCSSKPKEQVVIKKTGNEKANSCYGQNKKGKDVSEARGICSSEQNIRLQKVAEQKSIENNSYLSDDTTDDEFERFVQKNKTHKKEASKNKKKGKRLVKTNKKEQVNKTKMQEKSSSLDENSSRCVTMQDAEEFNDSPSSDYGSNSTYKRKKSQLQKSKSLKIEHKIITNENCNNYRTRRQSRKICKQKSQETEANVDVSSLQSWSEQYDSNFCDESSDSNNENSHRSIIGITNEAKENLNNCNEETNNNLLCAQEGKSFLSDCSYLLQEDCSPQSASKRIPIDTSNNSFDPHLISSKNEDFNSENCLSKPTVIINNICNLTQNQVESQSTESNLDISNLPSTSSGLSKNSLQSIPIITISSDESDIEDKIVSKRKENEVVKKTENAQNVVYTSVSEKSDIEITEVITLKKSVCISSKAVHDSENLNGTDMVHLYKQNETLHNENDHSMETTTSIQNSNETNNVFNFETISKEELKSVIEACNNITQVKQEKGIKNINSATYSTDICNEFNENVLLKSTVGASTSYTLERERNKHIDIVSSNSESIPCAVKYDDDDDVIIIDSEKIESPKPFHNKGEKCDNSITSNSFVKTHMGYKDICKLKSVCSSLQEVNNSVAKAEISENTLQNCLVDYKDIPELVGSSSQSSHIKTDAETVYTCSANKIPFVDVVGNTNLSEKELPNEIKSTDANAQIESVLQLVNIFKKELGAYRKIVRTQQNVQSSLKFIESHQVEKLRDIQSQIHKLLEDNSDLINNNSMKMEGFISKKECDILSNSVDLTQDKFQHSLISSSDIFTNSNFLNVQENVPQNLSHAATPVPNSQIIKRERGNSMIWSLEEKTTSQVQNPNLSCKLENNFEEPLNSEKNFDNSMRVKTELKVIFPS